LAQREVCAPVGIEGWTGPRERTVAGWLGGEAALDVLLVTGSADCGGRREDQPDQPRP